MNVCNGIEGREEGLERMSGKTVMWRRREKREHIQMSN